MVINKFLTGCELKITELLKNMGFRKLIQYFRYPEIYRPNKSKPHT